MHSLASNALCTEFDYAHPRELARLIVMQQKLMIYKPNNYIITIKCVLLLIYNFPKRFQTNYNFKPVIILSTQLFSFYKTILLTHLMHL
jgi:hypothetical protein